MEYSVDELGLLSGEGLYVSTLKIVRAKRLQSFRKPGHLKIELESEAAKREALQETAKLQFYKAQGNKVIVRSSQPFEHRVQTSNWKTYLSSQGLEGQFRVSKNGKLLPNTFPHQSQLQSQTQQQQCQLQQQQSQMQQQQQQFQMQQQSQMLQQQPQTQQHIMQQQQPQTQQQQPQMQQQSWSIPNTNVTYSNAVRTQPQRGLTPSVPPPAPPSTAALTNQFQFSIPPPRGNAPGF